MTKNDNFWSFLQFCYFCRFCHFWHFITFCLFPNFVTFVFSFVIFVTFDHFEILVKFIKKIWNFFMSDFQTLCWNWASSVFSSIVKVKSPARTQRPTWLNSWWLLTEFRTSGNKCKKTSPRSPPTAKLRRLLSFMIYFCVHLIFALTSTSTTWSDKLTWKFVYLDSSIIASTLFTSTRYSKQIT